MKNRSSVSRLVSLSLACMSLAFLALPAPLSAQVSWQRQAYGQGPFYAPGHQGDPAYSYYYPNNNNWSQELTYAYDNSNPPQPIYVSAPSNWSTATYPTSGDVTLGTPACNLDRFVRTGPQGGVLTLNSLTVQADGQLNIEAGVRLTLSLLNLQGNNNNDATITASGGGGALPVLILTQGGTLKKTTGTSSFMLDAYITLQVANGGIIAADTGALQLPLGAYAGGVNFNAATGALIDLAPAEAVDSRVIQLTGAFTGINTGGTVRLSKGWLSTVAGTGGATLNFGGNTFQWTGGLLRGSAADPFTNVGTINVTGAATLNGVGGFINQGVVVQSGSGTLDLYRGSFTNSTGAVYDIRNDLALTDYGPFNNYGTFRKSGGTGTSTLDPALNFDNIGGAIRVDSGTLALGHGLVSDGGPGDGGTFQVAAGATLALNDGTSDAYYKGTYTGSGSGTVLLSGGGLHGGATFNLPGAMFQWTGGTIVMTSGTPFINAGTLTIAGPVGTYNYSANFTNQGTIIQTGAGTMSSDRQGIINAAGAVWDIRNDLGYSGTPISNAGTFQKSAGSGTSIIDTNFDNSGTIVVSSGTLKINGGIPQSSGSTLTGGRWDIIDGGSGATLILNINPILTNNAIVLLSGPGAHFDAINSLQNNGGTFAIVNGRNFATAGDLTNSGTIEVGADTLTANGNVVNNGLFLFLAGGQVVLPSGGYPYSINSTTSFVNNGTLDIINDAAFVFPAGFVNQGTIVDSSAVKAKSISRAGTNTTVTINSYTGHTYQLQVSSSLVANSFTDVGSPLQGNTGTVLTFIDPGTAGSRGFYRIVVDS